MKEHFIFGKLTDRMSQYRNTLLNQRSEICVERAILATESYKEHADKPIKLKRAYMLQNILQNMSIFIEEESLIAGNHASENRAAPIFPEYAIKWVIDELDEFEKRDGDVFYISEDKKEALREIYPFWSGSTVLDKGLAYMPKDSRVFYDLGIIKVEGNLTSGDAHVAVDYDTILRRGLKDYEQRTKEAMSALDLGQPHSLQKYHFYNSILIVIDAMKMFAKRYSDLARNLAKDANEDRKTELLRMADALERVPYNPARNFFEAVQSLWLVHLVLQIESNGHSLSYGRMDQYLLPFLEEDSIDDDAACLLLCNLWMKTYTINKIRSWSHTQFSAGSPLYQNVTIAGQTKDGQDAINRLSYLILKSVAQTRLPQPNLTVRYHKGLNSDFMDKALEVVKLGFGMPAFNNDEIIIPSFIKRGVTQEDAYNYSAIGCVETAVPGRWGYRCTGMSFINFPKALLIAMNDGNDPKSGKKLTEGVGHFIEMSSYDDLFKAWSAVIKELTRHSAILENCCDHVLEVEVPDILCSALCDDCIGRGLTLKEGGAIYDFISGLQVGIANLADSLVALKKLVFEDNVIDNDELWQALSENFEGDKGEGIRQIILNSAPKYGNDDDSVDKLVVDAYNIYIEEIKKYPNTRFGRGPIGGTRYAGTSSISANVGQGSSTPATPDGRLSGEPLSEGCSPAHNMDRQGPTAVFKTVSKLPTIDITGGVLLNQKVNPTLLEKEENKQKLVILLRTFFDMLKGYHVQYNVVSRETLIDAQKHPENHKDLIVRVAGYSAFFNVLSKRTQDDIIERTEQSI